MVSIAKINTNEPQVVSSHIKAGSSYLNGRLYAKGAQDQVSFSHAKQTNSVEAVLDDVLAENAPRLFLKKYLNPKVIENAALVNPQIKEILSSKGLPSAYHMENITGKNQEHFITTYKKVKELSKNLPDKERKALLQAALLHDIGKAYIPVEILNKNGKLTEEERDIVNIHAKLGQEIIKTTGLSPKVATLAGLHHMPCTVPFKGVSANILSVADNYSALKEERPYKPRFTNEQVAKIMKSDSNLDSAIVAKCF